jgi:hypothetical protein
VPTGTVSLLIKKSKSLGKSENIIEQSMEEFDLIYHLFFYPASAPSSLDPGTESITVNPCYGSMLML